MNYNSDLFGKEKEGSFNSSIKRIAASIFIYFLYKNNMLFKNDVKIIDDATLVVITILIAQSKPEKRNDNKSFNEFFNIKDN